MRISDWSSDVCSSDLFEDVIGRTDRAREAVEITFETERLRAHIGLLIARRGFEPERAHRQFLQSEQRELVGQVARDEGFSPDRVEIAVAFLHAARAAPAAAVVLSPLDPAFDTLIDEDRADLVAFALGVLVKIGRA